jgi:hypothetical protein
MTLSETWFMEGYIDFELQKYRLLAYIQDVHKNFNERKLYPQLADIVSHYNNLVTFRNNKQLMEDGFPKKIDKIDTEKLEIVYERMLADNDLMKELQDITGFAMTQMKGAIDEGAEIYESIEKQMLVEPVGIMPLYKNEGYVFLRYGGQVDVRVYNYTITFFEHKNARYKGLRMEYVDSRTKNLANTYEQIKLDIIREIRTLPNPAVYRVEFPVSIPFNETLLPVAKRLLVRHIAAG